jgi:hypothetical protein
MTDTMNNDVDPGYSNPSTLDLVQWVQSGQPLEFEKTFNQLIQARISQLVDDKRLEVADQFFGGVDTDAMAAANDETPPEDPEDDDEIDAEGDEEDEEFVDPDEEEDDEDDGESA